MCAELYSAHFSYIYIIVLTNPNIVLLMPIFLKVPFEEKELVKAKGASWNPRFKSWYLPDNRYAYISDLERWMPGIQHADIILPSTIQIVTAQRTCEKCGTLNTVIALGAETAYLRSNNWKGSSFVLFHRVDKLSSNLSHFLTAYYRFYKPDFSAGVIDKCWSNHCISCRHAVSDVVLQDTPGAVFYPVSRSQAEKITLKSYQFSDSPMMVAKCTTGEQLKQITRYGKWEQGEIEL